MRACLFEVFLLLIFAGEHVRANDRDTLRRASRILALSFLSDIISCNATFGLESAIPSGTSSTILLLALVKENIRLRRCARIKALLLILSRAATNDFAVFLEEAHALAFAVFLEETHALAFAKEEARALAFAVFASFLRRYCKGSSEILFLAGCSKLG